MTANIPHRPAKTRPPAVPQSRAADRFVLAAQTLVILAFATGLSVQAGLTPAVAGSAAVAIVMGLLGLNTLMAVRGSARQQDASDRSMPQGRPHAAALPSAANTPEPKLPSHEASHASLAEDDSPDWPTEFDYAGLETSFAGDGASHWPPALPGAPMTAPASSFPPSLTATPPVTAPPPIPRFSETPRFSDTVPARYPAPMPAQNNMLPQGRAAPNLPAYVPAATSYVPAATSYVPAAHGPLDPAQDYWSHRPSQPRFDDRRPAPIQAGAPALSSPPPVRAAAPAPFEASAPVQLPELPELLEPELRETDVEAIQSLIKKLADEVNIAEAQRAVTEAAPADVPLAAQDVPPELPPPAFEPERAVAQSLDALRVTAETMRQPSHRVFGHELPPPIPAPPSRAAILAEAITAGRADVLLEPILGLQSQDAQHFEVSVRLRAEDGAVLALDPHDGDLRGTGLLPLFDAAKIARTATVARRLAERGKTGALFSTYSSEALTDRGFRDDAASASRQVPIGGGQLILTFAQSEARTFQAAQWESIADMRALGFRFAMSDITDLDMDIEGLVRAGFDFVKLDADVFLTGLRSPAGLIPSSDVCRYLAGLGLTLVVERIDDEAKFAQVYGFGALLGQGRLFGGARVLKAEPAGGAAGQAAA